MLFYCCLLFPKVQCLEDVTCHADASAFFEDSNLGKMEEDASSSDSGNYSLPDSGNFETEGTDFDIFSVHNAVFFQDDLKETTLYAGEIGVISNISGDVVEGCLITTNVKICCKQEVCGPC